MNKERLHRFAAAYLILQSLAVTAWWVLLFVQPHWRVYFKPAMVPDSALLAFALPDMVLLIGAGLWAAYRLISRPDSVLVPLALHTGGAVYATLWCLALWALSGEAVAGGLLMLPSAIVPSLLLWKLCRVR
jgi:hypothetical protein